MVLISERIRRPLNQGHQCLRVGKDGEHSIILMFYLVFLNTFSLGTQWKAFSLFPLCELVCSMDKPQFNLSPGIIPQALSSSSLLGRLAQSLLLVALSMHFSELLQ